MSSILLGEGLVCVLFAAPIFYGVGAFLVFLSNKLDDVNKSDLNAIVIIPVLLLLAQPQEIFRAPDVQIVETVVEIPKNAGIDLLNQSPDFQSNYPNFFKIGFPKPVGISGNGTQIGDVRNIQFESSTRGIGTLSLEVAERSDDYIILNVASDDTHIGRWLTWNQIKVEIIKSEDETTQIKWTSEFQCDLGPSWYFEPLEKMAVAQMNQYLIDVYFK